MAKNNMVTHLPLDSENWLDHPVFQAIQKNARWLMYIGLFLLLVLVSVYRVLSSRSAQAEKEFIQAEKEMLLLSQPEKRAAALASLKKIIHDHPELAPLYEGVMVQEFLNQGDLAEALPLAHQSLERVKTHLSPEFEAFSRTTFMIADKQYIEALSKAYQLKETLFSKLSEKVSPLSTLYAFNLLRIAFLEKELQHKEKEKQAWDELHQIANGTSKIKMAPIEIQRIMTHFDDQGAKLKEFIP